MKFYHRFGPLIVRTIVRVRKNMTTMHVFTEPEAVPRIMRQHIVLLWDPRSRKLFASLRLLGVIQNACGIFLSESSLGSPKKLQWDPSLCFLTSWDDVKHFGLLVSVLGVSFHPFLEGNRKIRLLKITTLKNFLGFA